MISSAYLEAIQSIVGATPQEKYRELECIGQRIVACTKSSGEGTPPQVSTSDVPEPLLPLVKLTVARISRQGQLVVDALKSEDSELINRALRIDWFFRAENSDFINIEYFKSNVFPFVSINTRNKLVNKLSDSLRASGGSDTAQDFYSYFLENYGKRPAEPLLVACREFFIWENLLENEQILSCRSLNNLFLLYPKMIIRYLKLSDPEAQNSYRVDLSLYKNFLPRLIKNHSTALFDLIEMHKNTFGIKLSNKAATRFLKNNVQAVIDKPNIYTKIIPLKLIAAKLTKTQYEEMFANAFSPLCEDFRYYNVKEYLEYYPEKERISLLLGTYKQLYEADMLEDNDLLNEDIISMLPDHERDRQARKKLEKSDCATSDWRCYLLPIETTIASIKTDIGITSSTNDRLNLLRQLFFTCKVNNDQDALLDVLRYLTTRHKNEQTYVIFSILKNIPQYFDLSILNQDFWSVMKNFLKFLHVKNEQNRQSTVWIKILSGAIHFELRNNLSLDESLSMLIEILIKDRGYQNWCILAAYPEYDKLCFEIIMSKIPTLYPVTHDLWKNDPEDILHDIVSSMNKFNSRNSKAKEKAEKLSIEAYPWLLDAIKKALDNKSTMSEWIFTRLADDVKTNDPVLYEQWFPVDVNRLADVETNEACRVLKKEHEKIVNRCNDYFNAVKKRIAFCAATQRFVKACRWYQYIPIEFMERCNKDKPDADELFILGILMKGSEFARIIEPLVPQETLIDTNSVNAKETYQIMNAAVRVMKIVNPPVPLKLLVTFCAGEYLNLGLVALTNVCRRTPVDKVKIFTKSLTDSRVSTKKHGVRLFCLIASIPECRDFLSDLWKTDNHRSIRAIVLDTAFRMFINQPCEENWELVKNCIVGLKIDDDYRMDDLTNLSQIYDSYVDGYLSLLLETIERLKTEGLKDEQFNEYVSKILNNIDSSVAVLLPEKMSRSLLVKYFWNANQEYNLRSAGMHYAMRGYLRAVEIKLEHRLNVFGELYKDKLSQGKDAIKTPDSPYCVLNYDMHEFVNDVVFGYDYDSMNIRIIKKLLESFLAVLKPVDDWITYSTLTFAIAVGGACEPDEIAEQIGATLPEVIDALSPEVAVKLPEVLLKWIKRVYDSDEVDPIKSAIIKELCRINTIHSCTLAASLLGTNYHRYKSKDVEVVNFLIQFPHPTVCMIVNEFVRNS